MDPTALGESLVGRMACVLYFYGVATSFCSLVPRALPVCLLVWLSIPPIARTDDPLGVSIEGPLRCPSGVVKRGSLRPTCPLAPPGTLQTVDIYNFLLRRARFGRVKSYVAAGL